MFDAFKIARAIVIGIIVTMTTEYCLFVTRRDQWTPSISPVIGRQRRPVDVTLGPDYSNLHSQKLLLQQQDCWIEQCFVAQIVHSCQQYETILLVLSPGD